jgi:hypothetical protein
MSLSTKIIDFQTGQDFDIREDVTIEITMGGISLLNLQQRVRTHTQSFPLPRTPKNEALLSFVGIPHFYATPRREVTLQKGLIMLRGFITVLNSNAEDFEINFDFDDGGGFADLKDYNFYTMIFEQDYGTFDNTKEGKKAMLERVSQFDFSETERFWYAPHNYDGNITSVSDTQGKFNGGLVIRIHKLFNHLESELGLNIDGYLENIPQTACLLNKWAGFAIKSLPPAGEEITPIVRQFNGYNGEFLSMSTIIKAVCQVFGLDFIQVNYNTFTFKKISTMLTATAYHFDRPFLQFTKQTDLKLAQRNVIKYKNNGNGSADGSFYATGIGSKDLFTMEATRVYERVSTSSVEPEYYTGLDLSNVDDVCILFYDADLDDEQDKIVNLSSRWEGNQVLASDLISVMTLRTFSLGQYFVYNHLSNVFTNPIMFEVQAYITPLEWENIMLNRTITNVSLNGKFFVEEMAYNLTTGNAILKLIKI